MSDFNTNAGVQEYVDEHSLDDLRELAASNRLNPTRKAFVERWLAAQDTVQRERTEEQRHIETRTIAAVAADATTQQAADTKRAADAAERQAEYARRALIVSGLAFAASLVAIIVSVAAMNVGK